MPPSTSGTSGYASRQRCAYDQRAAVRATARPPAGGVGVVGTGFAVRGIAVDHGIHVAGGDAEEEVRPAERLERRFRLPVRLGDDADAETLGLQQPPDDGHAEGGVIDVGIARDEDDVAGIPAQGIHLRAAHGQKRGAAKALGPVLRVVEQGGADGGNGGGWHGRIRIQAP